MRCCTICRPVPHDVVQTGNAPGADAGARARRRAAGPSWNSCRPRWRVAGDAGVAGRPRHRRHHHPVLPSLPSPGRPSAMSTSSPPRPARSCPPAAPRSSSRWSPASSPPFGCATAIVVSAGQMLIELDRTVIAAERDRIAPRSAPRPARRGAAHGAACRARCRHRSNRLCSARRCAGRGRWRAPAPPWTRRRPARPPSSPRSTSRSPRKSPKPKASPPPSRNRWPPCRCSSRPPTSGDKAMEIQYGNRIAHLEAQLRLTEQRHELHGAAAPRRRGRGRAPGARAAARAGGGGIRRQGAERSGRRASSRPGNSPRT